MKTPWPIIRPSHKTIASHMKLQMALMRIAKRIENAGVHFDVAEAEYMLKQEWKRIHKAWLCLDELLKMDEKQFMAFIGKKGIGVTKAAQKWFWETHKAPLLVFEKNTERPQFNTTLLTKYMFHDKTKNTVVGEVASYLLVLRAAFKTISFLENYLGFARAGNGKIHGGFNPLGTVGERWSASASLKRGGKKYSLNYQNIPSKSIALKFRGRTIQLVQPLRDLFLPPPGCTWLCFDYSSQEARTLAIFSGDERFAWMIEKDLKFHIQNAIDWFVPDIIPGLASDYATFAKILKNEADPRYKLHKSAYNVAKAYMYSTAYQHVRGAVGDDKYPAILAECQKVFPDWTEEKVSKVVQRYFDLHPAILHNYQRVIREEVLKYGYATHPLFGGRLYVEPPTVDAVTGALKSSARGINQCQNYYQQSGGFHIFGRAMMKLETQLDWDKVGLLIQVHDEIGAWCPIGEEEKWAKVIKDAMEEPWEFRGKMYSIPAEYHYGVSWGEAKG